MADNNKLAKALNQPTISAQPRSNKALGLLADMLRPVNDLAKQVDIPILGNLSEFTGLGGAQSLAEDMSYGAPLVRGGSLQTSTIDPRVMDVAALAPTLGPIAAKGAKSYGKMMAKELQRQMDSGSTLGKMIDPRMNITAYHGSPHTFDNFSLDKIGTGEGAQAYGHGLYFSDSPHVAGAYVGGAKSNKSLINGKDASEFLNNKTAIDWLQKSGGNPSVALEFLNKELEYFTKQNPSFSARREIKEAMQEIQGLNGSNIQGAGNFYKVDIPDEAVNNMLLWDKPLSEQKSILDAASKYASEYPEFSNSLNNVLATPNIFEGQHLYQAFVNDANSAKNASKNLNQYGIKGIRYLDQNSRDAGMGTMNTVLFDDNLVKILERNGQKVK